MVNRIKYAAFATLSIFWSCSSTKISVAPEQKKQSDNNEIVNLSSQKQSEFEYNFIEGLKQKMVGNPDAAIQYYSSCLELNPTSAAAMFELANIYAAKGDLTSSKLLLEKAVQINPTNKWYKLLLAQVYQKNKLYLNASEIYKQLTNIEPDNIDYYYLNAALLFTSGNFELAIKAYNELENKIGYNEEIAIARQHLFIAAGKTKEAYKEIEKLISANPANPEYYGLLADMYKEDGDMNKALQYYNKVIEADSTNGFVHFSLATYYAQQGMLEKAYEHANVGFSSKNVDLETKIQLYLILSTAPAKNKLSDEKIENLVSSICKTNADDSRSYTIYADFLIHQNRKDEARNYLIKATEIDQNSYAMWEQLIILDNELLNFENMNKDSEKALSFFPNQPLLYILNASALIQLKKYESAIEILEKGDSLINDDQKMRAQFEMYKAEAYYNLNFRDKAFKAFEKVIELEPDNFMAMNNYAYYLSLKSEDLEKAERLSGKVVQANPDNSTYLDTHAWVLFKKKEYRLAKFYMQTALNNGGDKNAVIVDHFGDILFMLDQKEDALIYWKKSLELGNSSKVLPKKIEELRYIEETE